MVDIIHSFSSGIADDPIAAAAGKVLPSHWNASHTISFSTTKVVAGRNFASSGVAEEVTLTQLLDWIGSAAQGDILVRGASTWARLAAGSEGQILAITSGVPAWAAPASNAPFDDSTALIKGSSDATKLMRFEVDGNTTGTTRVYTVRDRNGILVDDTDLALKANLASPALTGNPTAPTQAASDNSTKLATTAYADRAGVQVWGQFTATNHNYTKNFGNGWSVTGGVNSQLITFTSAFASTNYVILISWLEASLSGSGQVSSKATTAFSVDGSGTCDFAIIGP